MAWPDRPGKRLAHVSIVEKVTKVNEEDEARGIGRLLESADGSFNGKRSRSSDVTSNPIPDDMRNARADASCRADRQRRRGARGDSARPPRGARNAAEPALHWKDDPYAAKRRRPSRSSADRKDEFRPLTLGLATGMATPKMADLRNRLTSDPMCGRGSRPMSPSAASTNARPSSAFKDTRPGGHQDGERLILAPLRAATVRAARRLPAPPAQQTATDSASSWRSTRTGVIAGGRRAMADDRPPSRTAAAPQARHSQRSRGRPCRRSMSDAAATRFRVKTAEVPLRRASGTTRPNASARRSTEQRVGGGIPSRPSLEAGTTSCRRSPRLAAPCHRRRAASASPMQPSDPPARLLERLDQEVESPICCRDARRKSSGSARLCPPKNRPASAPGRRERHSRPLEDAGYRLQRAPPCPCSTWEPHSVDIASPDPRPSRKQRNPAAEKARSG